MGASHRWRCREAMTLASPWWVQLISVKCCGVWEDTFYPFVVPEILVESMSHQSLFGLESSPKSTSVEGLVPKYQKGTGLFSENRAELVTWWDRQQRVNEWMNQTIKRSFSSAENKSTIRKTSINGWSIEVNTDWFSKRTNFNGLNRLRVASDRDGRLALPSDREQWFTFKIVGWRGGINAMEDLNDWNLKSQYTLNQLCLSTNT